MAIQRPEPQLDPALISYEQFHAFTPEKFELVDGYLFDPPGRDKTRLDLLSLLLTNVGLTKAVQLAPLERWQEALKRVYGSDH